MCKGAFTLSMKFVLVALFGSCLRANAFQLYRLCRVHNLPGVGSESWLDEKSYIEPFRYHAIRLY